MTDQAHTVLADASSALGKALGAVRMAAGLAFTSGVLMGTTAFITGAGPISLIVLAIPTVLAIGFVLVVRELRRASRRGVGIAVLLAALSTVWIVNNLLMVPAAIAAWYGVAQARRWTHAGGSRAT